MYSHKDVIRKEESDLKVVYLCRKEGASSGEIKWSFNFDSNRIESLEISLRGMTEFHNVYFYYRFCLMVKIF